MCQRTINEITSEVRSNRAEREQRRRYAEDRKEPVSRREKLFPYQVPHSARGALWWDVLQGSTGPLRKDLRQGRVAARRAMPYPT